MPEGKPPTPLEDDAEECLHCAIVDMVEERIAAGGADAANLAALIAESLVEVHPPGTGGGAGEAYGAHAGGFGRLLSSEERCGRRQLRIATPLTCCPLFVLMRERAASFLRRGPGGNNSYHPPCGPRRLLCIGRAIARSLVARQADRRGGRSRARRLVRGQGLWNQRRHVRTAGARALSAPDLCWRTF